MISPCRTLKCASSAVHHLKNGDKQNEDKCQGVLATQNNTMWPHRMEDIWQKGSHHAGKGFSESPSHMGQTTLVASNYSKKNYCKRYFWMSWLCFCKSFPPLVRCGPAGLPNKKPVTASETKLAMLSSALEKIVKIQCLAFAEMLQRKKPAMSRFDMEIICHNVITKLAFNEKTTWTPPGFQWNSQPGLGLPGIETSIASSVSPNPLNGFGEWISDRTPSLAQKKHMHSPEVSKKGTCHAKTSPSSSGCLDKQQNYSGPHLHRTSFFLPSTSIQFNRKNKNILSTNKSTQTWTQGATLSCAQDHFSARSFNYSVSSSMEPASVLMISTALRDAHSILHPWKWTAGT